MGDYDTACPWGPDALSTSTAMDAYRLSIHASPQEAREHAQMCIGVRAHMYEKQGVLPSITPPTLTSAAYTPLFPPFLASYSLIGHD